MKTKPPTPRIAACLVNLPQGQAAIQLFPAGEFYLPHGAMIGKGPWRMDAPHAAALIARVAARKTPIVIDYEHQTLLSEKNGQPAPASGWIATDSLEWRTDGLYAVAPDWTPAAAAMIEAGEYRFLSPVFKYDEAGYPTDLINVALTNQPAIDGMSPVALAAASALLSPKESPMDDLFERLCYLLNLPMTTTPDEMSAQLDRLKAMLQTSAGEDMAATGIMGVFEQQSARIAALSAAKPDPAEFVPMATFKATQTELAALRSKDLVREVDGLVVPALEDGRLLPAQESWARDLGASNLAALKSFLDTAQPIAALRGMQSGGKAPDQTTHSNPQLNEDELAVCKQMGIAPDAYLAAKTQKEAR